MAMFVRAKRVSDPLNDNVKARIRGDGVSVLTCYASSGSEHDADPLFSCPIHTFLEDCSDQLVEVADSAFNVNADIDSIFNACDDPFVLRLRSDVARASTALDSAGLDRPTHRRAVMAKLREYGYNAGVCKAEWGTSGSSLTAGSYEYIDVMVPGGERYLVDLWFAAEFEVARATEEYAGLVAGLPRAAVGTAEEMRRAVRAMAARRSMKSKGLHLPLWRKRRYMMAKWFGPYRRTISGAVSVEAVVGGEVIKCRAVGVEAVVGGEVIKCRAVGFVAVVPERVVGLTNRD